MTADPKKQTKNPKPAPQKKKRHSTFNAFDREPKGASVSRSTHKAALGYITGIRS